MENNKPIQTISQERYAWKYSISLLQNGLVMSSILFTLLVLFLLVTLTIFIILLIQGNVADFASILTGLLPSFLVVIVIYVIAIWMVLGNKYRVEFTIDSQGVHTKGIDTRMKNISALATWIGIFSSQSTLAGAGLLALSSNEYSIQWKDVKNIELKRGKYLVHLFQSPLHQIQLHCIPEDYDQIIQLVKTYSIHLNQ